MLVVSCLCFFVVVDCLWLVVVDCNGCLSLVIVLVVVAGCCCYCWLFLFKQCFFALNLVAVFFF